MQQVKRGGKEGKGSGVEEMMKLADSRESIDGEGQSSAV
jgi:hypothetical protein